MMSPACKVTPEQLFDYTVAFTQARIEQNSNKLFPTFKEAASAFQCKLNDVENAIYDYQGNGYLGYVVAYKCGSGLAPIRGKANYLIEADPA